jgi:hypothetical protein
MKKLLIGFLVLFAIGPIAAPFMFWPISELAGCQRAGMDTLKCVRAEWLSEFATIVVHLPLLSMFTVPLASVIIVVSLVVSKIIEKSDS